MTRGIARERIGVVLVSIAALVCLVAGVARAADPGRFADADISDIPIVYYQGVTSDPQTNLYFDGISTGLYKTDSQLHQLASNPDAIPASVKSSPGYNHIGDISYDTSHGGRVLLPIECYYPGTPGGGNTCHKGGVAIANSQTLQWEYYVDLDPAEIPKTMWNEVSPDGSKLWTSSGADLIAYDVGDINPANAVGAPGAQLLHKVATVANGVPASGITGATFYRGRLYMAGQADDVSPGVPGPMQVWSIDLSVGQPSLRLEMEKNVIGESEGLDVFHSLGGVLHWQIQPIAPGQVPTYSPVNGTLLHFNPVAADVADTDGDGLADADDNCPAVANSLQGLPCSPPPAEAGDTDRDGVLDAAPDNCAALANNDQANTDRDPQGDACDPDNDNDGVLDGADNCRYEANADQANHDSDARGDACDLDDDNDNVLDGTDNCRTIANSDQADGDGDTTGDSCDNCPQVPAVSQADADRDGKGDPCDSDDDNDGLSDTAETRWKTSSSDQDSDDDGLRDGAEDRNGNGKLDRNETSPRKRDTDRDGLTDGLERGTRRPISALNADIAGTDATKFRADRNPKTKTNPRKRDTDRDGIRDGREDRNRNGRVDKGETNPSKKNKR